MKQIWFRRPNAGLFLLISYCLWGAVTLRWIAVFIEQDHPLTWVVVIILLSFGLLMGLEPLLTPNSRGRAYLYLGLQTTLVFLAMLLHHELDFFALLYIPLCGQAMFILPRNEGLAWTGLLIGATAIGQAIQFGGLEALSFTLLYAAALVFVAAFVRMTLQADQARQRSEQLLADLQNAHNQLQAYTNQAEELAIANERTRLARDLHDSVAQTLYGLTLQAEAASRKLAAGQTSDVEEYLGEMGENARQTLQETRLLIFELRPPILNNSGLAVALKARLEAVEGRSGVTIHQTLQAVTALSPKEETNLYRIAQEALNNAAKYARASELHVLLTESEERITLEIADNGIGFDPELIPSGSVGLLGIAERVEQMNGHLAIESVPNKGTKIHVEIPI